MTDAPDDIDDVEDDDLGDDETALTLCKELYALAVERETDNRQAALDDLRFVRLREQWPENIKRQRELDGRPCMTIDKLSGFIKQVVNDARQNRPEIKVHPVNGGANQETAEVFNGLIRNIEAISHADTAYDTAFDFSVSSGLGYLKVNTRYADDDTFDQDLIIERVPDPSRIWGDPFSLSADSADWDDAWEVETLSKKAFAKQFPKATPVDWDSGPYSSVDPEWREGDRVVIAKWWHREVTTREIVALSNGEIVDLEVYKENQDSFDEEGVEVVGEPREVPSHKVICRIVTGHEVIKTVPWKGKFIPIIPIYGDDIVVEGRRYLCSLIRPSKETQQMYNFARSAETETVALAPKTPFIGPKGAFATDADKWETANEVNHAFIEYDGPTAPERQQYAGPPAGWMSLAASADADMKAQLGMFDASLGKAAANEQSGKAILGLQRQSDTSTFHFVDNMSRGIRHLGIVLIDLVPWIYSTAREIRVITGEQQHAQVQINQPIPTGKPVIGANGQPITDPETGQPIQATMIYDLTSGKYDLTVAAGPGYATRREEAADQMLTAAQVYPEGAPVIIPRLATLLDWPGADEIANDFQQVAQQKQQQGDGQTDAAAMQAKIQAESQAKAAQLQQEGQLRSTQITQEGQLKQQEAERDAQLERYRADQKFANERYQIDKEIELERYRIQVSGTIDAAEASHRMVMTARVPQVDLGGRPG